MNTIESLNAATVAELQAAGLKVQPNGYGHRIECETCGWSKCHGTATEALDHVDTHGR